MRVQASKLKTEIKDYDEILNDLSIKFKLKNQWKNLAPQIKREISNKAKDLRCKGHHFLVLREEFQLIANNNNGSQANNVSPYAEPSQYFQSLGMSLAGITRLRKDARDANRKFPFQAIEISNEMIYDYFHNNYIPRLAKLNNLGGLPDGLREIVKDYIFSNQDSQLEDGSTKSHQKRINKMFDSIQHPEEISVLGWDTPVMNDLIEEERSNFNEEFEGLSPFAQARDVARAYIHGKDGYRNPIFMNKEEDGSYSPMSDEEILSRVDSIISDKQMLPIEEKFKTK